MRCECSSPALFSPLNESDLRFFSCDDFFNTCISLVVLFQRIFRLAFLRIDC